MTLFRFDTNLHLLANETLQILINTTLIFLPFSRCTRDKGGGWRNEFQRTSTPNDMADGDPQDCYTPS